PWQLSSWPPSPSRTHETRKRRKCPSPPELTSHRTGASPFNDSPAALPPIRILLPRRPAFGVFIDPAAAAATTTAAGLHLLQHLPAAIGENRKEDDAEN